MLVNPNIKRQGLAPVNSVIGWDIGGANLKAARAENGVIVAVTQQPCTPHLGLRF